MNSHRHRLELMRQIYNGGGDDLLDSPKGGGGPGLGGGQDSVFSCLESMAPGLRQSGGGARWVQLPADMCVPS